MENAVNVKKIAEIANSVIESSAKTIEVLKLHIDMDFIHTVQYIHDHPGSRVIITGVGKSAIIATKIVSTLNSTGTPAIFLHAADAVHGDVGMVGKDDIVIMISQSGESPEIKVLLPVLRNLNVWIVGMTGNPNSYLAKQSRHVISTSVSDKIPYETPAPTVSTTAQLVMGDALAVCLLYLKGFTTQDFAKYHPGGALGKQLYMRVRDIYPKNEKPMVKSTANISVAIIEITSKRMGATAVVCDKNIPVGIITDGDVRRMLQDPDAEMGAWEIYAARDIMNKNPKTISPDALLVDALQVMRKNKITQLLVMDGSQYVGMIHLHDILNEGII